MRLFTQTFFFLLAPATLLACGGDDGASPLDASVPPDAYTQPFAFDGNFAARPDASFAQYTQDDTLSIFHVQLEATHNSYHLRPSDDPVVDWDYEHAPLDVQLEEQGVRGLELDLNWDDDIGVHRVLHIPTVDARSTCDLFVECLAIVRTWSDAHADHVPLVIHLEPKGGATAAERLARMLAIENEIRSVWPDELILTPDRVRGDHATLPEALAEGGWPTLGETRGHVLFVIDDSEALRDAYVADAPSLEGRVMFVDSEPGDTFGAYAIINDAFASERIEAALDAHFLVRVFGQDSVESALAGDRTHLDRALASGAHVISSDFPAQVEETTFFVEIPEGAPSRCNPSTAPEGCTSSSIEDR
ncbi:Ca2+-dependent phosphoinositide-specific phospholipase C [Sandaracinus amylolyticus]|uniref:Ca2+-dependent phosphoinositide-specific phospholipase C n=1 Tax=Sandaracinus amylolyticus TaxID=927083 RepID=UPI001F3B3D71|nr:Ca2+-dependent phosphoinositide-specific phospholipase C [Sandaracinus amylolyticus]UJR86287.1 Hypothetical protein I5071_83710 [Sandaracinus amylolyticus]